jgi:hypothetical protein
MNAAEIIRAHAQKEGMDPDNLALQIQEFLKQPNATVVRDDTCLFLIQTVHDKALFYIVSAGNESEELKTITSLLHKMGFKKAARMVFGDGGSSGIKNIPMTGS